VRGRALIWLGLFLFLALPAAAGAAEVREDAGIRYGSIAFYTADPGEANHVTFADDVLNQSGYVHTQFVDPGIKIRGLPSPYPYDPYLTCKTNTLGATCNAPSTILFELGDKDDAVAPVASALSAYGPNVDVRGGLGDDTLSGALGKIDSLSGGEGNDTILAADSKRDFVQCGPGDDKVIADKLDDVATDCERVTRLP
jgi:hypothetical protein